MDKKENNSQDENKEQPTSTMTVNNEKETKTEKSKVVVAIGTSGVGKSSVLNLLCGRNTAFKTSDSTEPCTVHWSASGWDEKDICLVDTADPEIPDVSEKSLYERASLILWIVSKQVLTHDRPKTAMLKKKIQQIRSQRWVPVLLVINHCDFDNPIDRFYHKFQKQLEECLVFDRVISICAISLLQVWEHQEDIQPFYISLVETSRERLRNQVFESLLLKPPKEFEPYKPRVESDGWCMIQ